MRLAMVALAITLLRPWPAFAQQPAAPPQEAIEWEFSSSVYFYQVVDDRNYAQPTVTADRDWLHLEARYNYEDLETGSLWLGYNVSGGETVEWSITPMLGGVFGLTDAVAPGYKASVSWRKLEFYSEGEYAITSDSADGFLYNWSELTVAPRPWWRIGLVTQRTRVYETERELSRGLLVGFTYKALTSAFHLFNPDDTHPVLVFSAALDF